MDKIDKKIFECENLTLIYKSAKAKAKLALDNLSFSLEAGQTLSVVGESGSGKSTLLKCATGLLPVTKGKVCIFGKELNTRDKKLLQEMRFKFSLVLQDTYGALPPASNVLDAVTEPLFIQNGVVTNSDRERALVLLDSLKLADERLLKSKSYDLSGGQRQRVQIARALVTNPMLLFADEPTSMQDASTKKDIINLLNSYKERGMAMIFVTHDILLAATIGEKMLVLKNGVCVEQGNSHEILTSPSHEYTKALLAALPKI